MPGEAEQVQCGGRDPDARRGGKPYAGFHAGQQLAGAQHQQAGQQGRQGPEKYRGAFAEPGGQPLVRGQGSLFSLFSAGLAGCFWF